MNNLISDERLAAFNAAFQGNNCDYAYWGRLFREAYDYLIAERAKVCELEAIIATSRELNDVYIQNMH